MQQLREEARRSGALRDNDQQRVVVEDHQIEIAPAQPEVIYVPQYNPTVVYSGVYPDYAYPPYYPYSYPGYVVVDDDDDCRVSAAVAFVAMLVLDAVF